MKGFIEVTLTSGVKQFINISYISRVLKNYKDGEPYKNPTLLLNENFCREKTFIDVEVEEVYEEIKQKIKEAQGK